MKIIVFCIPIMLLIAGCAASARKRLSTEDIPPPLYAKIGCSNPDVTREAIVYYRNLFGHVLPIRNAGYRYLQEVTTIRKEKAVEKKRRELLKTIQLNKDFFTRSGSFQGDTTLKSYLTRYLDLVCTVLKEDFGKIPDMENITRQSTDGFAAHERELDLAARKLDGSFGILKTAEVKFFNQYEITDNPKNDEFRQRIEKTDKAVGYYRVLHMMCSEVIEEASDARKAIDKNDIQEIEWHTRTLVYNAEKGLRQVKEKTGYEGDSAFLLATIEVLEFYRQQGLTTFPSIIELAVKADTIQKAMDKFNLIEKSYRTQADIDAYDTAVNLHDRAVEELNKINSESLKTTIKILDSWSNQGGIFFKKFAPNGRL